MNKSSILVQGIGEKGIICPTQVDNEVLREYKLWVEMLRRCTSKYWIKCPTYTNCTVSESFKYYPNFYKWCQEQKGFDTQDERGKSWHLDKDLLAKGNKVYGGDVCVFVPHRLNTMVVSCKASRGIYPVGVSWDIKHLNFKASCQSGDGVLKHLGSYKTPEQAFQAYKTYKEALIKEVASEYKSQLDPRAYQALLNYTVEITD